MELGTARSDSVEYQSRSSSRAVQEVVTYAFEDPEGFELSAAAEIAYTRS